MDNEGAIFSERCGVGCIEDLAVRLRGRHVLGAEEARIQLCFEYCYVLWAIEFLRALGAGKRGGDQQA